MTGRNFVLSTHEKNSDKDHDIVIKRGEKVTELVCPTCGRPLDVVFSEIEGAFLSEKKYVVGLRLATDDNRTFEIISIEENEEGWKHRVQQV